MCCHYGAQSGLILGQLLDDIRDRRTLQRALVNSFTPIGRGQAKDDPQCDGHDLNEHVPQIEIHRA